MIASVQRLHPKLALAGEVMVQSAQSVSHFTQEWRNHHVIGSRTPQSPLPLLSLLLLLAMSVAPALSNAPMGTL